MILEERVSKFCGFCLFCGDLGTTILFPAPEICTCLKSLLSVGIFFCFRSEHEMQQVESIFQNNTVSTVFVVKIK
jgi:hypothetical protein